jgi:hypothetical protein
MTKQYLSPWALALALSVTLAAQEPERKPEVQADKQSPPANIEKTDRQSQKPAKPEPERKGGLQTVDAPQTAPGRDDKGSTTNLGTDVVAVRQRIEAALQNDPSLKGVAFTLNVTDDTVEISGVANHGRERTAARRIVQSFAGNLRVKDRITVAGATPPSADASLSQGDQSRATAAGETDTLAKPESDQLTPARKANKPKKDPAKHGDRAIEEPRDPRIKN